MDRIKYLDGIRGIAVICVLFFHLGLFPLGFIGVEIFFVISGYIITYLLMIEINKKQKIDLSSFFRRRISRIYPPLFVMLLIVVFIFTNYPMVTISDKFHQEVIYSSFGLTNWYEVIHNNGYWEAGTKSPLLHMWSIAIEIQFYLIYPFYVWGILKFQKNKKTFTKKYIIYTTILFLLLATVTYYYSFYSSFNILYYSTFTRISSFLIGGIFSALSFKYHRVSLKSMRLSLFSYLALFLLLVETFILKLDDLYLFRGLLLVFTILLGFIIFSCSILPDNNILKRILCNKVFLFYGKISYSLYLWHIPVIIFVTPVNIQNILHISIANNFILISIQTITSMILAIISNKIIEQKIRITSNKTALALVVTFPLIMIFTTSSYFSNNIKIANVQPIVPERWIKSAPIISDGEEPLLIVGDSWSRRIAFGMNEVQKNKKNNKYKLLLYGVGNGSIMDPDYIISGDGQKLPEFKTFEGYLSYWEEAIRKYHPNKVLLVFGFADQAQMVINGTPIRIPSKKFNERYFIQFKKLVDFFKEKNIKIYMTNIANNSHDSRDIELNKYSTAMEQVFEKAVKQNSDGNIHVLDIRSLLSNGKENISPYTINSIIMYDETNHPSYYGAEYIGEYILNKVQ